VVVGIPADLLRRRPDVRRAERTAAAQAELIGIAAADLYPALSLTGTLGWQAANLSDLFKSQFAQQQRGAGVPVEHPELRPDSEQRAVPGGPVPGVGGRTTRTPC
jgi:outer membrane protein TolC